jgi:hypothetical protein
MDQNRSKAEKLNESGWVSSILMMSMVTILPLGNLDHPEAQSEAKPLYPKTWANKSYHHFWIWSSFLLAKSAYFLDWWVDYVI